MKSVWQWTLLWPVIINKTIMQQNRVESLHHKTELNRCTAMEIIIIIIITIIIIIIKGKGIRRCYSTVYKSHAAAAAAAATTNTTTTNYDFCLIH